MFRLLILTTGVAAALGNSAKAQRSVDFEKMTVQERGQVVLDALKAATESLAGVKNEATAETAKQNLRTAESLLKQAPWMKDVMTGEETKWVLDVFEPKRRQAELKLEIAQDKLAASNPKLFDRSADAKAFQLMKSAKIKRAELSAQNLNRATKAYYIVNEKWPAKLIELAVPSDGSRPFVEGGKDGVIDPWGREYKLSFEKTNAGDEWPVVSTVSPYRDGKEEIRWPEKAK